MTFGIQVTVISNNFNHIIIQRNIFLCFLWLRRYFMLNSLLFFFIMNIMQLNMLFQHYGKQLYNQQHTNLSYYNLKSRLSADNLTYISNLDASNIQTLIFSNQYLNPRHILILSKVDWSTVKELRLNDNLIGNKGSKYLSRIQLNNLQKISLILNQIEDSGLHHLTKSNWKHLKELNLCFNLICHDGLYALIKSNFNKLQIILLVCNKITFSLFKLLSLGDHGQLKYISAHQNDTLQCQNEAFEPIRQAKRK